MMQRKNIALVFFILISIIAPAQKQNKNELEDKKKKIQQEIEYTNNLLKETKNNKKKSLNELLTLNKKIGAREELINVISGQLAIINKEINTTNASITQLEKELKKLKDEYAKMIYHAYKNRDAYSKAMFIFGASSFNQAYMRLKYLQQYGEYRHKQADDIIAKQNELALKLQELEKKKAEKRELLGLEQEEKETLKKEKNEKEEVLTELQSKEGQLKADLEKKKSDAKKLQQAIQAIIEDEIRKAKEKAKSENKPTSNTLALTPEAQQLSNSFSSNKGKLPWPVIQGVIVDRFGVHPHPTMADINISNNGVDISTSKGGLARAVFDGEVTGIANIPSSGKVIIIRHGEYLSVYSNLKEVYVKSGDKIKTKQNIGSIIHDDDDGKTELHIEIWKGQTKLDPEDWLFKN